MQGYPFYAVSTAHNHYLSHLSSDLWVSNMSVDTRRTSDSVDSTDVSRYDALLMAVPLPLFVGALGGAFTSNPLVPSVGVAGVVSAVLVWYALFVDTPIPTDE